MSELMRFRLVAPPAAVSSLWTRDFDQTFGSLGLRLDMDEPHATSVLGMDGLTVERFDNGRSAWEWLESHDGSITIWGAGEGRLSLSVERAEDSGAAANGRCSEIDIGLDLPRSRMHEAKPLVDTAEAVSALVFQECEGHRGIAVDEMLYEALFSTGVLPASSASGKGVLPNCLGYWNAFRTGTIETELLTGLERAGANLEMNAAFVTVRLARWPWELQLDDVVRLSRLAFGSDSDV